MIVVVMSWVLNVENHQSLRRYLQIQATRALRRLWNAQAPKKVLQKNGVIRGAESLFACPHILPKRPQGA